MGGFSTSPRMAGQDVSQEQLHSPPSNYANASPPPGATLQYPSSPIQVPQGPPQPFVSLQDVSPSPTVSPDQVCSNLPPNSPAANYAYPGASPFTTTTSQSSYEFMEETSSEVTTPSLGRRSGANGRTVNQQRYASSDEESRSAGSAVDSGESEREDEADDADDDEYKPEESRSSRGGSRRRASAKNAGQRSFTPLEVNKTRMAPPVPVPNLTKKSRGRRVPTTPVVISQNGVEKVRLCARTSCYC